VIPDDDEAPIKQPKSAEKKTKQEVKKPEKPVSPKKPAKQEKPVTPQKPVKKVVSVDAFFGSAPIHRSAGKPGKRKQVKKKDKHLI